MILNLVELLMDMGVLKQCLRDEAITSFTPMPDSSSPGKGGKLPPSNTRASVGTDPEKTGKPMSSHWLIMNVIVR